MSASTLTSKGQTTIPKDIRDALGLKPSDELKFTLLSDGTVLGFAGNSSPACYRLTPDSTGNYANGTWATNPRPVRARSAAPKTCRTSPSRYCGTTCGSSVAPGWAAEIARAISNTVRDSPDATL